MLYKLTASFLSSVLQTVLYALLLTLAYYFWSAPNAGLIIGTASPVIIVVFFLLVFLQNWITFTAKNKIGFIVFAVLTLFWVLPFVTNFTWLSPILTAFNTLILYLPLLLKKKVTSERKAEDLDVRI